MNGCGAAIVMTASAAAAPSRPVADTRCEAANLPRVRAQLHEDEQARDEQEEPDREERLQLDRELEPVHPDHRRQRIVPGDVEIRRAEDDERRDDDDERQRRG